MPITALNDPAVVACTAASDPVNTSSRRPKFWRDPRVSLADPNAVINYFYWSEQDGKKYPFSMSASEAATANCSADGGNGWFSATDGKLMAGPDGSHTAWPFPARDLHPGEAIVNESSKGMPFDIWILDKTPASTAPPATTPPVAAPDLTTVVNLLRTVITMLSELMPKS